MKHNKSITSKAVRNRNRQRRNIAYLRRERIYPWTPSRRNQRQRRSILDLLFLPPFLIMDELIERLRDWLNVT